MTKVLTYLGAEYPGLVTIFPDKVEYVRETSSSGECIVGFISGTAIKLSVTAKQVLEDLTCNNTNNHSDEETSEATKMNLFPSSSVGGTELHFPDSLGKITEVITKSAGNVSEETRKLFDEHKRDLEPPVPFDSWEALTREIKLLGKRIFVKIKNNPTIYPTAPTISEFHIVCSGIDGMIVILYTQVVSYVNFDSDSVVKVVLRDGTTYYFSKGEEALICLD